MPDTRCIGSRTVIVDDADADRILARLVQQVRTQI